MTGRSPLAWGEAAGSEFATKAMPRPSRTVAIQQDVQRPASEAAEPVIRAATEPDLASVTILGPTRGGRRHLWAYVNPEVTAAVRKLTAAVLPDQAVGKGSP